jgi:hypothetical protein
LIIHLGIEALNRTKDSSKEVSPQAKPRTQVELFLEKAASVPVVASDERGRLIFALDATMSRQPTWDLAQALQGRMFETAAAFGGLDVQLVYFRGFGECKASPFVPAGGKLSEYMSKIEVRAGTTQIGKVLKHVGVETRRRPVRVLVFVGDAMEESADIIAGLAGELALLGVKAFVFQEGKDAVAEQTFRDIARLTGGAYASFDLSAPEKLAALLAAAAAYAAGGKTALQSLARSNKAAPAHMLLAQMS